MFGDDVLVMPVTAPVENDYAQVRVWLPEGEWYEWHTGALLKGNQIVERSFAVDEYPIYIKAGAILPMYLDNVMNLNGNDEEVAVTVSPVEAILPSSSCTKIMAMIRIMHPNML